MVIDVDTIPEKMNDLKIDDDDSPIQVKDIQNVIPKDKFSTY